jgi:hypothetical protein
MDAFSPMSMAAASAAYDTINQVARRSRRFLEGTREGSGIPPGPMRIMVVKEAAYDGVFGRAGFACPFPSTSKRIKQGRPGSSKDGPEKREFPRRSVD